MIDTQIAPVDILPPKGSEAFYGFILLNKPSGITSFDVIHRLRIITGVRKIGHAGTLDPFATGVLAVAIGKPYTTRLDEILTLDKEYEATMCLGVETDTLDCKGKVTRLKMLKNTIVTDKMMTDATAPFRGDFMQEPPLFSAKKVDGRRAHKIARKGREITLESALVSISELTVLNIKNGLFPECTIRVACSKGTYIRSLIRDISKELDSCAFTKSLVRTKIGKFTLSDAVSYDGLNRTVICKNLLRI